MPTLEIINFRSAGSRCESIKTKLLETISPIIAQDKSVAIKIYHHAILPTDLSVHIWHESLETHHTASPIGLCLTAALKECGLVNHTLWTEIETPKEALENKGESHEKE